MRFGRDRQAQGRCGLGRTYGTGPANPPKNLGWELEAAPEARDGKFAPRSHLRVFRAGGNPRGSSAREMCCVGRANLVKKRESAARVFIGRPLVFEFLGSVHKTTVVRVRLRHRSRSEALMRVCFNGHRADGGTSRHRGGISLSLSVDCRAIGLCFRKEVSGQVPPSRL